jgi:serine/threonine protein kinase
MSEISVISESSPLHYILDTGRFKKKFKDIKLIGEGGFGKVYKATNYVDRKEYAIKVIRLHIKKLSGRNLQPPSLPRASNDLRT